MQPLGLENQKLKSSSLQSGSPAVSVRGLGLDYGPARILGSVDLDLPQGRTLALLGSSGCGKTTLLRLLAGLLMPTRGSVSIGGQVMADAASGTFVPPERRGLGMVFQDYALWPHMSVFGNVAFPLEMAGVSKSEIERRVKAALARVGLEKLADRGPGELSGGQQQRVAIARAIVGEPRLVLFDEPLSNLDRDLRESLAGDLAELLSGLALSAVYVTHDQGEAFTIADQVAIMQGGAIVQMADPETLVDAPASPVVAEFLKLGAVVAAERQNGHWALRGAGVAFADASAGPDAPAAQVMLGRKAITVIPQEQAAIRGRVMRSRFHGDAHVLSVALGEGSDQVLIEARAPQRGQPGENIGLVIEPSGLRWFPA